MKTLAAILALTATAILVKKIISDKKFHDVEIINIDETCSNTPSSELDSSAVSSIRIEEDTNSLTLIMEDDDIISSIKVLMNDECSSFKYAVLEAALSQAENGNIDGAIETMELIGEEI